MVSLFKSPVHILGTNTYCTRDKMENHAVWKKKFSPSRITMYGSTYVHYDSSVNEDLWKRSKKPNKYTVCAVESGLQIIFNILYQSNSNIS